MTTPRLALPASRGRAPVPDDYQLTALELVSAGRHVVAVGAPGSGKTSLAVMAAARAAQAIALDRILVLAPTRAAASALRDRISIEVAKPSSTPVARTAAAAAFAVLSAHAAICGEGRPALISGAEQDAVLKELLEGRASGRVEPLDWGHGIPQAATVLPAFREELRNLLMRAAEAGLGPHELASLGVTTGRPEWIAAGRMFEEYENVTALRTSVGDHGARYDPATVIARASYVLDHWESEAGGTVPTWDLLIVDDYHEATAATASFVRSCVARGARLLLTGNADQTVQGYRGALASGLDDAISAFAATRVELCGSHRLDGQLLDVTSRVVERIGVKGAGTARTALRATRGGEREAGVIEGSPSSLSPSELDAAAEPRVVSVVAAHASARSLAVAAELRAARATGEGEPIPWSSMAVVARSQALLRQVRSDLLAAAIPCESLGEGTALHREPAVAALVLIARVATGEALTEETALEILTSRPVGLDTMSLRRIRRELVREERAGGGTRDSTQLVIEALEHPHMLATMAGGPADALRKAAAAIHAARQQAGGPSASPAAVLWAAWAALDVAQSWRSAALAGSSRDDADLDAVIALFREAQGFAQKLPHARIGAFLDALQAQDFAADSLGARARVADSVSFHTPASVAGSEFDVVAIVGLEEGVWPNTTLRDSILGAQRLADILAGAQGVGESGLSGPADMRAARAAVIDDETRALAVAVSRARSRLILASIDDGETRPSHFLGLIEAAAGIDRHEASHRKAISDPRTAIAALRAEAQARIEDPDRQGEVGDYVTMLASAAAHGFEGAHPATWHGAAELSTVEPLWPEGSPVRVSPSKVESVELCALRWAFEAMGGASPTSDAQEVGTLIHELAHRHPHGGAQEIMADFESLWALHSPVETWKQRRAYEDARHKVLRLIAYLDARSSVEVRTEQAFKVEIADAVLAGSADRVEVLGHGAYVVDIKTGATMPTVAEAATNAQLEMYQLAIAMGAIPGVDTPLGAELAFVSSGSAAAIRAQGPIDKDRALERLTAVVSVMRAGEFLAVVNERCGACPVRRACPAHAEGRQVTQA